MQQSPKTQPPQKRTKKNVKKTTKVDQQEVVAPPPCTQTVLPKIVTTKKSKLHRRSDKLNRVISKLLKEHPDALKELQTQTSQAEIARVLGSRSTAGAASGVRKRTVFVTFTSENFKRVRRENPSLKPNEVFRELARQWREEISKDPKQVAHYARVCDRHNANLAMAAKSTDDIC